MGFADQQQGIIGRIAGNRVAKIAGVIAMLALMFVVYQFVTRGPLFGGGSVASQIDNLADGGQPMSPLYAALREEFPKDYDRFKRHLLDVARKGGNEQQVAMAGHQWMRNFTVSLGKDFSQAPKSAIFKVRDDYIELAQALAGESTRLCAQFGMIGLAPGTQPSDRVAGLLARAGADQFKAAAAGRKKRTDRAAPGEADARELAEQLAKFGMTQMEIGRFFGGGGGLQYLPVHRQCVVTLALYKSLAAVSEGASERLSAAILLPKG